MTPRQIAAGILFGLLGFAGHWQRYELFFNLAPLFGAFFVMLALLRFDPGSGSCHKPDPRGRGPEPKFP